jgi:hypothetical protein
MGREEDLGENPFAPSPAKEKNLALISRRPAMTILYHGNVF